MKYLYLLLFALAVPFTVNAQFSEDFEGIATNTDGLGDIPTELGWTLYDEDGLTVAGNVAFVDEAWIVYTLGDGNQLAVSTSWYAPVAQADDWMVTPSIMVPNSNPFLIFEAMSFNAGFKDDYEVLISTTGNQPADFTTVLHAATAPPTSLTEVAISLSDYSGQQVYIAFRNVTNDGVLLGIDNFKVFSALNNDIEITSLQLNDFSDVNTDNTLKAEIKNVGGNVINSTKLTWTDGTNTYSKDFTGLNLQPFALATVSFDTAVNYASAIEAKITVTASNVNGATDPDLTNNTATTAIHLVTQLATKYVVAEEGTGTWCGFCPRGIVAMEYMYENYPHFIGIAVHTANGAGRADPMDMPVYADHMGLSAFPGSNVGRTITDLGVAKSTWIAAYNTQKEVVAPAAVIVEASYDQATRVITATVSAEFYTGISEANYRLAMVVVEDSVTAPWGEAPYTQTNYYADAYSSQTELGAMGGFEDLPAHVEVAFDRVAIAMLGGFKGAENSVPTSITAGDTPSFTFTYTVPDPSDPDKISLVGLLIDQTTGHILNAIDKDLGSNLGIVQNPVVIKDIKMYPNPTSELLHVSFGMLRPSSVTLNVYSMTGRLVKSQAYENLSGTQAVEINVSGLSTGEYLVSLSTNQGSVAKTIIVE